MEYLAPGVYVEEVSSGNKPIEGASTSTAGMVGVTQRGPVNEPTLVTSFGDFNRLFGGVLDHRIFTENRDALRSLGFESIVFSPLANRPDSGDYLTGMAANIDQLNQVRTGKGIKQEE